MLARLTSLEQNALKDPKPDGAPEPKKPELAFSPIERSGNFSILFNKGLAGLDFINELGVEVKTKGTVSELFADEAVTDKQK